MTALAALSGLLGKALSHGIPKRAATVAAVVAPILILINQGDAIFGEASFSLGKAVLTAIVPYLVATAGAVSALSGRQGDSQDLPVGASDALTGARDAAQALAAAADSEREQGLARTLLTELDALEAALAPSKT